MNWNENFSGYTFIYEAFIIFVSFLQKDLNLHEHSKDRRVPYLIMSSTVEEIKEFQRDEKKQAGGEKLMERLTTALFESPGANLASARGTLWGALNKSATLLTGNGTPEIEAEARRRGADAFLHKPLPLPESIARAVLGGGPLPAGAAAKPMEKA